jgi:hypothetical protein
MKHRLLLGVAGVAGLVAVALAFRGPGKLTIGSETVDTTFIVQAGRTFVPLSDVAKALGTTAQKTDEGFTIPVAGAGSMVTGTQGKVGQTIGTAQMQFTVEGLVFEDHYQRKHGDGTIEVNGAANRLVIVNCKVRNATAKTISICTVGGAKTALADTDEHTYEVYTGDGPRNADILPGSVIDFGLAFQVPKDAKLKALVYETDGFPQKKIFRVSLADQNSPSGG